MFPTARQAAETYIEFFYEDVCDGIWDAAMKGKMNMTVPYVTDSHEYSKSKIERELLPYLTTNGYHASLGEHEIAVSWADKCIKDRYAGLGRNQVEE